MKKTLFLSAILGAALCSSAFGATVTVTTNNADLSAIAGAGDKIDINLTGDNVYLKGNSNGVTYNILADVNITAAELTNGYSNTQYQFKGALSGSGTLSFRGTNPSGGAITGDVFAFHNDASAFSGTLSINGSNKLQFINDTEGLETLVVGASSVVSTGSADDAFKTSGNVLFRGAATETEGVYSGTVSAAHTTIASGTTTIGSGVTASLGSLSMGDGAVLSVASGATLGLTTDSSWTMDGEETARTSGNGWGTATYTKVFGTSLVNNGTITVNGSAATMTDGVVTGTGNSTTYYVNEGAYTTSLPGATKLVVNSTSGGDNRFGMSNTAYGNLDITINGGRVITAKTGNGTGFTSGDVVINGGGTLAVVESGQDALGWDNGVKTRSLTLEGTAENNKATFELSYNPEASLTLATNLNMNGHSQVTGTRAFNTYGGVITATGTDNVISAGVQLRKAASFVVNEDSTLLISGNVTYGASNDRSMTKTGAGVLTISGNISGNSATELVAITGDGANTVISSGTISHATLNNVKLAKGSAQTINGTVTLNSATLTNELDVYSGGSLTLQNGATTTQTSGFAMIVGKSGHTGTLTFEAGTYDLSKPGNGIAVYKDSTMTVKSDATLSVQKICYSYNEPDKNGDVTVEDGGVLNITNGGSFVNSLTSAGTATVGGNIHAQDFLKSNNSYTQTAGTATIEKYLGLAANAGVALSDTGKMVVKGTSTDTGNGIWMGAESTITMGANSTLEVKPVGLTFKNGTITNTSTTDERQVGTNTNQDAYRDDITISADTTVNNGQTVVSGYTFSGGSVTVNSGTTTDINSTLSATTDLTVNSGSTANLNAAGTTAAAVNVNGDLTVNAASTVKQLGGVGTVKALADLTVTEAEEGKVTLGGLEIAGGKTVTLGTEESHNQTITLNSLTVGAAGAEEHTTLNANLEIAEGGTMDFSAGGVLTMGCDVTIYNGVTVTLSSADYALLTGHGDDVFITLFDSVESFNGPTAITVTDGTQGNTDVFFLSTREGANGTEVGIVPEPATATLSLLALAALAARRKRK